MSEHTDPVPKILHHGNVSRYLHDGCLDVPEGVTKIGYMLFFWHSASTLIREVRLPQTLEVIEESAFGTCRCLTSITIPRRVRLIDTTAFVGCLHLREVIFEDGETPLEIGEHAFGSCALTQVALPSRLCRVDVTAFSETPLKRICMTSESDRFFTKNGALLERKYNDIACCLLPTATSGCYTVPDGVTAVQNDVFGMCGGTLTQITAPESLRVFTSTEQEFDDPLFTIVAPQVIAVQREDPLQISLVSRCTVPLFSCTDVKLVLAFARGYLLCSEQYGEEQARAYRHFIQTHLADLLTPVLALDAVDRLAQLETNGFLTADTFDEYYLKPAVNAGAKQCLAFLIAHAPCGGDTLFEIT